MVVLAAACPQEARARVLPDNDLDSLVYLAEQIVEGEVVRSQVRWDDPPSDIKVTAVFHGSLRVNQHISVPIFEFVTADSGRLGTLEPVHLAVGDTLIFFLEKARRGLEDINVPDLYRPVGSGLKLVIDGNVYSFHDGFNPGAWWVSDSPARNPILWPRHSVEEFSDAIKPSVVRAAAWRAEFAVPATKADIPRLLSLLQTRSAVRPRDSFKDDVIADIAMERLATLHDLKSLHQAMAIDSGSPRALAAGFGTPQGRDFLLEKVADPKEPLEMRLAMVDAIAEARSVYRSTMTETEPHVFNPRGDADENNSFYLTRIARLVASDQLDYEVRAKLVSKLPRIFLRADRRQVGTADLREARSVLEQMSEDASLPLVIEQSIDAAIRCIRLH